MSSFSLYSADFSVARPNHVGLITNYWLLYWLIDWLALIDCLMLTVLCPPDPSFDAKTYSDYMNSGEFFCTKSIQLDVSKSSHFLIRQILTDFLNFCTAGKRIWDRVYRIRFQSVFISVTIFATIRIWRSSSSKCHVVHGPPHQWTSFPIAVCQSVVGRLETAPVEPCSTSMFATVWIFFCGHLAFYSFCLAGNYQIF